MPESSSRPLTLPHHQLTDGTVFLRGWTRRDLAAIEAASQDSYIPQVTSVPAVYTPAAGGAWLARQSQRLVDGTGYPFAICDALTDTAIGFTGLWPDRAEWADVGYWVIPAARGHGIAQRALRLVTAWAFGTLGLTHLRAKIEPWNVASRRTAEHVGFVTTGQPLAEVDRVGQQKEILVFTLQAPNFPPHFSSAKE